MQLESAGTNRKICEQLGTTYISKESLDNASQIYVMEQKHLDAIQKEFGKGYYSKTTVLHIPDIYKYSSKELIEILESKITF